MGYSHGNTGAVCAKTADGGSAGCQHRRAENQRERERWTGSRFIKLIAGLRSASTERTEEQQSGEISNELSVCVCFFLFFELGNGYSERWQNEQN